MTRIVLIMLAVAAFAGVATTPAGAMHINLSAPRISGGIAGGSQALTPRPFNRIPDVSIPIRDAGGSLAKRLKKPYTKNRCESLYVCCLRGQGTGCCDVYNDDNLCPY
jgi:hypothetical protein